MLQHLFCLLSNFSFSSDMLKLFIIYWQFFLKSIIVYVIFFELISDDGITFLWVLLLFCVSEKYWNCISIWAEYNRPPLISYCFSKALKNKETNCHPENLILDRIWHDEKYGFGFKINTKEKGKSCVPVHYYNTVLSIYLLIVFGLLEPLQTSFAIKC